MRPWPRCAPAGYNETLRRNVRRSREHEGLEKVQVKNRNCRALRLGWLAAASVAAAIALLPAAAAAQSAATQTTLNVTTSDRAGQTLATAAVTVVDENGQPAAGAVEIEEGSRILASAALSSAGQATAVFSLPGGSHALTAVYTGDATRRGSSSPIAEAQGTSSSTPNFQVTLTPVTPSSFPMVLTQGQSGTAEVTITPLNNSALTSPMFVTVSCSGLPNEASCTFTPESVEILADTPASCPSGSPAPSCPPVSSMLLETQAGVSGQQPTASVPRHNRGLALALLFPGALSLGGLAWGMRRRRWLSRVALLVLLGLVTTLGVSGCSPLYRYYQHGPGYPPATPTGSYTITVTAQSSNGVTAITNSTTLALTVQ
jgi:hypothetical protein